MKSQLDVLEQDLRALQIEFKKKNTQIKDVSAIFNKVKFRAAILLSSGFQIRKIKIVRQP